VSAHSARERANLARRGRPSHQAEGNPLFSHRTNLNLSSGDWREALALLKTLGDGTTARLLGWAILEGNQPAGTFRSSPALGVLTKIVEADSTHSTTPLSEEEARVFSDVGNGDCRRLAPLRGNDAGTRRSRQHGAGRARRVGHEPPDHRPEGDQIGASRPVSPCCSASYSAALRTLRPPSCIKSSVGTTSAICIIPLSSWKRM
jgi:hypothetical protein